MNGRHVLLECPHLGRRVNLWAFGSFGLPLVVFPSAAGFAHEWQHHGMVEVLAPLLRAGRIKLYCPESNVAEAWTRKEGPVPERMRRHAAYERFVVDTLVPALRADCGGWGGRLGVTGCSLGAMYAALFALKFPETFDYALCMSGRYQATTFTQGWQDQAVYFNNPLAFVPNLSGAALERVQQTHLALVCGQGMWEEGCIEETQALADVCAAKGIPHTRDIWGHDVAHNWEWWKRQAWLHLRQRYG